jgi:hypothetical protein
MYLAPVGQLRYIWLRLYCLNPSRAVFPMTYAFTVLIGRMWYFIAKGMSAMKDTVPQQPSVRGATANREPTCIVGTV